MSIQARDGIGNRAKQNLTPSVRSDAVGTTGKPELLIADEPTTALDATVQAQILLLLKEIPRDTGMALVLISHDLAAVAAVCSRICVM